MQFNNFLGAYYRDTSYGGDRLYADMLAQARLVDRLGFRGVTIPEGIQRSHRGSSYNRSARWTRALGHRIATCRSTSSR